jgi:hypothetical protein
MWFQDGKWRCGFYKTAPHAIGYTLKGAWRAWLRYFPGQKT